MAANQTSKYAFLNMPAPPSYVAGLGRGASGFTTRSDIGPAREGTSFGKKPEDDEEEGGGQQESDEEKYEDADPDNETGLFAGMVYEQDDEEADKIYDLIDSRMDERRRARREARIKEEEEEFRKNNPRIQDRFTDLKRNLGTISDVEWENLPEVGNLTGKRRKTNKFEGRSYAVPDSVLTGGRDKNALQSSLDEQQMSGGYESVAGTTGGGGGAMTNIMELGKAQNNLLELKLDQVKDGSATNGSATSIDPKGYLTDLDSMVHKSEAEIGDTKRARTLLSSLIKTNPKHAPGWIAAARVEEVAGKMVAARRIIDDGCKNCPTNEEVWREAARLNTNENAKIILANAIQHIPQSVNIWLEAADLEGDVKAKKRVLRKSLEYIPNSIKLWRATVSLEESPEDARILLQRAVEMVPLSVELWLALARVETPDRARKVLNEARAAVPTSHEIWIAAARLHEQENGDGVDVLIGKGVKTLRRNGVELTREEWIKEAEKAEENGSIKTAGGIIKATIGQDVDEDLRADTWIDDALSCISRGKYECARAIFAYALGVIPNDPNLWRRAADLEKNHGSREALLAVLEQAVNKCPRAEVLWLMAAKESWLGGDVAGARKILADAFAANPESEQIWLAACKLEAENNQIGAARQLMKRARDVAGTDRIWMKSAVFERIHGTLQDALDTVNEGIKHYRNFAKLYMIKGQILESQNDIAGAREAYNIGTKECPTSSPLWILSSRLEEKLGVAIKARAILQRARHYLQEKDEDLWLESISYEERQGNVDQAKRLMAEALQKLPKSGPLWAKAIWMEERPGRKRKSTDGIKNTDNDPRVLVAVARLFWTERKLDKARSWFARACKMNSDLGDSWAWWYKFELQHGDKSQQETVLEQCAAQEPHHGPEWQSVAKDIDNVKLDTKQILQLVEKQLK